MSDKIIPILLPNQAKLARDAGFVEGKDFLEQTPLPLKDPWEIP